MPRRSIDPDVDLHDRRQREELHHHHPRILGAVAVGGVIGAEARYALALAIKHPAGAWPWSTLLINVIGCLLIGVLMAALGHARRPPQLLRPFVGTGILGGFTTFSTYAVDVRAMAVHGEAALALAYAGATIVACLAAVAAGSLATRALLRPSPVAA